MNIHFTDKKLYTDLCTQSVGAIKVGSHMYGLDNENSDTDWLTIYVEPVENRKSIMWEHHQLQYKKDNVDYNFSSINTFIRNALTGDSTINFEVIWSEDIKKTKLNFLSHYKNHFVNYNIIKSYLGFSKRDLKYWNIDTKNGKKHTKETHKKLSHFVRGVIFAKMLIDGNFTMNLKESRTYNFLGYSDWELLDRIKHGTLDYSFHKLTVFFEKQMHFLRVENNTNHEKGKIHTYMNPTKLSQIDNHVSQLISNVDNHSEIVKLKYNALFYKTLENGVEYAK